MIDSAIILAVLLQHHSWSDRHISHDVRARALTPVAEAIAEESSSPAEAARLIALGLHESRFAVSVVRDGCSGLPASACDHRRARGAWQLHTAACSEAYEHRAGTEASIHAEARCAVKLMRGYMSSCREHGATPAEGAFSGYATGGLCHWRGAEERAKTALRIEREIKREAN